MGFLESAEKPNSLDKALSASMRNIVKLIEGITEFSRTDLMAISVCQTDPILKELLKFRVLNTKHLKRKHAREGLTALKYIAGYTHERKS
ncbi:unnamed protein product, partial [marine sediment metagenome]